MNHWEQYHPHSQLTMNKEWCTLVSFLFWECALNNAWNGLTDLIYNTRVDKMTLNWIATFNIHSWINYIQHNSRREATAPNTRHNLKCETRHRLYSGLLIHNKTRKTDLIDTLFEKGLWLSVSYDRVQQIASDVANRALASFDDVGVV